MAKKDKTGNRKPREQKKQFKILGLAAQSLDEYMKVKPGRSWSSVKGKVKRNHQRCVRRQRCISWWERLEERVILQGLQNFF